jgi:CBS domain-containing protein
MSKKLTRMSGIICDPAKTIGLETELKLSPAITVHYTSKIIDVAKVMSVKDNTTCVLVIDDRGQLCGILTDKDIVFRVLATGMDPKRTAVHTVMTSNPVTATLDTAKKVAMEAIYTGAFWHIPIISDNDSSTVVKTNVIGMINLNELFGRDIIEKLQQTPSFMEFSSIPSTSDNSFAYSDIDMISRYEEIRQQRLTVVLDQHEESPPEIDGKMNVSIASNIMKIYKKGAVIVCDTDSRSLLGILTTQDLILRVVAAGRYPTATSVKSVMTPNPPVVNPNKQVSKTLQYMLDNNYKYIVIGADLKITGIVDILEVTRAALQQLQDCDEIEEDAKSRRSFSEDGSFYESSKLLHRSSKSTLQSFEDSDKQKNVPHIKIDLIKDKILDGLDDNDNEDESDEIRPVFLPRDVSLINNNIITETIPELDEDRKSETYENKNENILSDLNNSVEILSRDLIIDHDDSNSHEPIIESLDSKTSDSYAYSTSNSNSTPIINLPIIKIKLEPDMDKKMKNSKAELSQSNEENQNIKKSDESIEPNGMESKISEIILQNKIKSDINENIEQKNIEASINENNMINEVEANTSKDNGNMESNVKESDENIETIELNEVENNEKIEFNEIEKVETVKLNENENNNDEIIKIIEQNELINDNIDNERDEVKLINENIENEKDEIIEHNELINENINNEKDVNIEQNELIKENINNEKDVNIEQNELIKENIDNEVTKEIKIDKKIDVEKIEPKELLEKENDIYHMVEINNNGEKMNEDIKNSESEEVETNFNVNSNDDNSNNSNKTIEQSILPEIVISNEYDNQYSSDIVNPINTEYINNIPKQLEMIEASVNNYHDQISKATTQSYNKNQNTPNEIATIDAVLAVEVNDEGIQNFDSNRTFKEIDNILVSNNNNNNNDINFEDLQDSNDYYNEINANNNILKDLELEVSEEAKRLVNNIIESNIVPEINEVINETKNDNIIGARNDNVTEDESDNGIKIDNDNIIDTEYHNVIEAENDNATEAGNNNITEDEVYNELNIDNDVNNNNLEVIKEELKNNINNEQIFNDRSSNQNENNDGDEEHSLEFSEINIQYVDNNNNNECTEKLSNDTNVNKTNNIYDLSSIMPPSPPMPIENFNYQDRSIPQLSLNQALEKNEVFNINNQNNNYSSTINESNSSINDQDGFITSTSNNEIASVHSNEILYRKRDFNPTIVEENEEDLSSTLQPSQEHEDDSNTKNQDDTKNAIMETIALDSESNIVLDNNQEEPILEKGKLIEFDKTEEQKNNDPPKSVLEYIRQIVTPNVISHIFRYSIDKSQLDDAITLNNNGDNSTTMLVKRVVGGRDYYEEKERKYNEREDSSSTVLYPTQYLNTSQKRVSLSRLAASHSIIKEEDLLLKCFDQETEQVYRINYNNDTKYEEVIETILKKSEIDDRDNLLFGYLDEDRDFIKIESEEDFQQGIWLARKLLWGRLLIVIKHKNTSYIKSILPWGNRSTASNANNDQGSWLSNAMLIGVGIAATLAVKKISS